MIRVWKGVSGIRDLTKIQCGIRETSTGKGFDLPGKWDWPKFNGHGTWDWERNDIRDTERWQKVGMRDSLGKGAGMRAQHYPAFQVKKVTAHTSQRPKRPQLIPVSLACSMPRSITTSLEGMLVDRSVAPSSVSPVPIYTPGWRETGGGVGGQFPRIV